VKGDTWRNEKTMLKRRSLPPLKKPSPEGGLLNSRGELIKKKKPEDGSRKAGCVSPLPSNAKKLTQPGKKGKKKLRKGDFDDNRREKWNCGVFFLGGMTYN